MRFRHCCAAVFLGSLMLLAAPPALAQTATDLNEGLGLVKDHSTEVFTLSWWAKADRSYFVQTSLDLVTWSYLPLVEGGTGAVAGIQFTSTEPRQFWRLRHTDAPNGGNAETADFDGDGVQNLVEVTQGTDPFLALDGDSDGVPDDWELANFGTLGRDLGLDTDGDGVSDHDEALAGTDPRDWRDHPGAAAEAVVQLSVFTPLAR